MSKCPLVSIVTPSFNAARFIAETIESVHSQDYPRIEHIVMDGGSTDGTLHILERYPHLIWVSEADRGQSHALNKGFQRARGEIIGWLNADDTYQPGAISTAVNHLLKHPDTDVVHSDLQIIDENSRPVRITYGEPFRLETFFLRSYIKQPTVFMRRRVLETLGGVDESLHYVMDREYWLRAGLSFKFAYLPGKILANFRLCQGTKSHDQMPNFHAEWLKVLENAFQNPTYENLPPAMKRKALQKVRANYAVAEMIQATEDGDRRGLLTNFGMAISQDWRHLWNRGTWLTLTKGIFKSRRAGV